MFQQIAEVFETIFSKTQCQFRKEHIIQQCLLAMLEKWKRSVDSGKTFGAQLKEFDCFDHELLIGKLMFTDLTYPLWDLFIIICHIENWTRDNNFHSEWNAVAVMSGVPQRSIGTTSMQHFWFLSYTEWCWYCKLCKRQYAILICLKYVRCSRVPRASFSISVQIV